MASEINEIKNSLTEYANAYLSFNWKNENKNKLCNLYIEEESSVTKQALLSAIILRYWQKIYKISAKYKYIVSDLDIFDILVDSITYALDRHRWTEEDSNIYNDPNGPDKVINRKIDSLKVNLIISQYRDKRKSEINSVSLDEKFADENDESEMSFDLPDDKDYFQESEEESYMSDLIKGFFEDTGSEYKGLIIDAIVNTDCFDENHEFSSKKLALNMKTIDNSYCELIAERYELNPEKVKSAIAHISKLTTNNLQYRIEDLFNHLATTLFKGYSVREEFNGEKKARNSTDKADLW